MHPERLVGFAAIGKSAPAGITALAIEIGLNGAAVAGAYFGHAGAYLHYLDAELMAGDARVAKKGHLAQVAANIGAANTHLVDAYECLPRPRLVRTGDVNALPVFRGSQ